MASLTDFILMKCKSILNIFVFFLSFFFAADVQVELYTHYMMHRASGVFCRGTIKGAHQQNEPITGVIFWALVIVSLLLQKIKYNRLSPAVVPISCSLLFMMNCGVHWMHKRVPISLLIPVLLCLQPLSSSWEEECWSHMSQKYSQLPAVPVSLHLCSSLCTSDLIFSIKIQTRTGVNFILLPNILKNLCFNRKTRISEANLKMS